MKAKIYEEKDGDILVAKKTIGRAVYENGETLHDLAESNLWSLKGKKIAFLGDSITQGVGASDINHCYVNVFGQMTGADVYNYGVATTRLAKKSADDTTSFISRVPNIPENVDTVIVLGGVNDYAQPFSLIPFGSFTDGANPDKITFAAGVHNLFKSLANKFQANDKKVIIVLPLHYHFDGVIYKEYNISNDGTITFGKHNNENTYQEYIDMISMIASFYGFPVINAHDESGLNPFVDSTMFADLLHPSDKGHFRLATYLIPKVKDIMRG